MAKRVKLYNHYESRAVQDFTALEVIANKSVSLKAINHKCAFHPLKLRNFENTSDPFFMEQIDCQDLKPVVPLVYNGKKCFTYFSQLVDWTQESELHKLNNEDASKHPRRLFEKMTNSLKPPMEISLILKDEVWDYLPNWNIMIYSEFLAIRNS